ncbi:MAG: mandelate racemase/muconate lactonizing enzyme family protein, partial [Deltaproteobacteria bacterium]|nr:mandelate racemase/muconate lactonizing enzyme family protein [Deltaproteobacteria bacterium]
MRLTRISWIGYRVPFKSRFVAADLSAAVRHGLLLRLEADCGLVGCGDASPVGAASAAAVEALGAELVSAGPRLLEISGEDFPRLVETLPAQLSASLRFGVETALCDLAANKKGCPVASLLGGNPRSIPVNALLFSNLPAAIGSEARRAVELGFKALKLKVGALSIEEDIARVAAVRLATGPGVALRIDANQAWSAEQAVEVINRLRPHDIEYVEQPVAASDLRGMAKVRRSVSTPVAADEAIASLDDARRVLEMEAADFVIVKAARTGLLQALAIVDFVRQAGRPVILTSSLESDIGVAAALHLASARELTRHPCGLATGSLLESTLVSTPLSPTEGFLSCPQHAGLGVIPDERALKRYATQL